MGFDFSKLNPFKKKTLESRAASAKTPLVISYSWNIADKEHPHCVRECAHLEKNHAFKTPKELVIYVLQKYGGSFEISEYEHIPPLIITEFQYKALFDNYAKQFAKK
ncbi:hypothetical protein HYT92_03180 [Candidatus Pacearchaeota archaeon]|nr:hypothetical protein [Candidatus Pacearchaeota archaeon]